MARWLVTGGVGFIGYHVVQALLDRGDRVTVIDDFSDAPYPAAMKERNLRDLTAAGDHFEVLRACVTDSERTRPSYAGVTGVLHLAGLAGVRPSFASPARYARVNVEGTAVSLKLALEANVHRFVFASSSSVYGNRTPLPARESAAAVEQESPYAASKRSAELLARAMSLGETGLACTALRFFTVYGPRQRPEMAITTFARNLLAQRPIVVFGDGSMRRDFTHVSDIVRGVVAALDEASPGYRTYNLGSGAPVTLTTLVAALANATGVDPVVRHEPVPRGDVDATFADISLAEKELAWRPRVPLEEGLKTVVSWLRDNPGA